MYLRNHPEYVHTLEIFGDPEDVILSLLDRVPFGGSVRLVVTAKGADHPLTYDYAWYRLRPDIRWEWTGHRNAWIYELVAKLKNVQDGAWS
jgi:hypothetical protein